MSDSLTSVDYEIFLIKKFQTFNILCESSDCFKCNKNKFLLCERKRGATKLISWRCKCGQYKSIRDGSFFSLYRTPLTHLALIIKMWAAQLTITKAVSLFELLTNNTIHRDTVSSVFLRLRNICSLMVRKN